MKKIQSSLLCGLVTLMTLFPNVKAHSLKEITKPHLGIYECTEANLGGKDYLDLFSYIHLELKTDGEFVIYYAEKNGEKKWKTGKYEYDRERKTLTLLGKKGSSFTREFPLDSGVLTISVRIGEQTLTLTFEQK